jgi:hypothetical protein
MVKDITSQVRLFQNVGFLGSNLGFKGKTAFAAFSENRFQRRTGLEHSTYCAINTPKYQVLNTRISIKIILL